MTLRELMIERILFCMTEEELQERYCITLEEFRSCSDVDFLDTYEEIVDTMLGF